MATKIRAARFMVYSAAELKQEHESYGTESAMAKLYASDVCLEVVNDAVQIYGGYGYIKGFAVERMYRDAKICTIYEGTNEIHKLIISHAILHNSKKAPTMSTISGSNVTENKQEPKVITENRKGIIIKEGSSEEKVSKLVEYLKSENIKCEGNSIAHIGWKYWRC